ncbi:MAG: zinc-binding alcohol dehydrogenase/oxidoreductase [Pirellulaceae bacterium]|jgi:zinc-binding alcohol dehydrogenase/oxidoreductase
MKSLVLNEIKTPLALEEQPAPLTKKGDVIIKLHAAALNRRDFWITQGMYPDIKLPIILGSDGAGEVVVACDSIDHIAADQHVIINPGWEWGDSERAQDPQFKILGMPERGTFAEIIAVPYRYVHPLPSHLDFTQAAALPLAGVTAYRALFSQGQLQAGENVLISGVGGGVATFALQFAVAAGANVIVTSSSQEKIAKAIALGAKAGYDYRDEGWHKAAASEHGDMNLIIDSGAGDGYANLVDLAAFGGRIVNYGATAGPPKKLDMFKVFWKQLHLIGTTMGSPRDFSLMLEFVGQHQIVPAIDQVFDLEDGNVALDQMRESPQFGKLVLAIDN